MSASSVWPSVASMTVKPVAAGEGVSYGLRHLLVSGTPVVRDGELVPDAYPGRPFMGEPR